MVRRAARIENENQPETRSQRHARAMYDPGQWFMFPKKFLLILSTDEALMLAALINMSDRVHAEERSHEAYGWFYYRLDAVEKDLRFSEDKQGRILKILKEKQFILYQLKGVPARRFFKIDFEKILEAIIDAGG